MTIAKATTLHERVFSALSAAFGATIPVYSYQPEDPPERYCRIDGFTIAGGDEWKGIEQGNHSFTVHLIDAPPGGTLSLARVLVDRTTAHNALKDLRLDARSQTMSLAAAGAALEPQKDDVRNAHAFLRYNAIIGE